MAPERTRVVVSDANVLINLIHVRRLDLLGSLAVHDFVVPPEVEAEIREPEQAEALAKAFDDGDVARRTFAGTAELTSYAELIRSLGRGEAACLAMAEAHGWHIASDERRRFRRLAEERLGPGRLLTTPHIYVLAIRGGLMTTEDADKDKVLLEGRRFKMRFGSFRDVLDRPWDS